MRRCARNGLLLALLLSPAAGMTAGMTVGVSAAPVVVSVPVETAIAVRLGDSGPLVIGGRTLDRFALRSVYGEAGLAPAWLADGGAAAGGLSARGAALFAILTDAARQGLDPAAYHRQAIVARLGATADPRVAAELDLLLTDALMRYVPDLRRGRIAPDALDPMLAMEPVAVDRVAAAVAARSVADLSTFLAGFEPPHPQYRALRDTLERLREVVRTDGWPRVGPGPVLKPGMRDPVVPEVRRRLAATGEFAPGLVPVGAAPAEAGLAGSVGPDGDALGSDLYDVALVMAVRRFQARHGLAVDGVIGPRTRAAMNVSAAERVGQVVANMERLRWLPSDLGERHVVVNVPGFSLEAVENGRTVLDMPVIVGTRMRETPVFSDRITYLEYNPTWTIPTGIATKDILPRLKDDPGYLIAQGIRVYADWSADAEILDPYEIDWDTVGTGIRRFRLRQEPGPLNALGRVKFMFPNRFNVYLHDTPGREKFARPVRTFSSGCVRVGDPDGLADFLLQGMAAWDRERRRRVLDSGRTTTAVLDRPVPVHLVYQTVWRDSRGVMQFLDDIYERDRQLLDALERQPAGRHAIAGMTAG